MSRSRPTNSASAEARAWIEDLPAGAYFRSDALPVKASVAHNVLHRLMSEPLPIIGRAGRGVYWRQPPPASRSYGVEPFVETDPTPVLAPAGSGYARFSALVKMGWCTQMPSRVHIAVPYRNLTPLKLFKDVAPVLHERSNKRRRSLNWNEVTVLEAALASGPADYHDWEQAMWAFAGEKHWMAVGHPIRRDKLAWAAETEPVPRKWPAGTGDGSFESVMSRLHRDLPETIELTAAP